MLINTITKTPLTEWEFRKSFSTIIIPSVLTDEILRPFHHAVLKEVPAPTYDSWKYLFAESAYKQEDGTWLQTWELQPNIHTPSEIKEHFLQSQEAKFVSLKEAFFSAENTGVVNSSLGFPIDANERANRDVSGLISQMEMTSIDTTQFCDANNDFHEVTLDNLKTMQLELIQYAQSLYATKWQFRATIEAASTVDELNAIDIKFVTDFTPAPVTLTDDASH